MSVIIVNNRIDGTRITVYDIVHYLEAGRSAEEIQAILPLLTLEQVRAAIDYIEAHKKEVMAVHRQIEDRIAQGNPPEVEAQREETRARMQAWLEERRRVKKEECNGEGNPGGR